MRVKVPEDVTIDDEGEADDAAPWERDVPEGWQRALIRKVEENPRGRGESLVEITFEVQPNRAWVREELDVDSGEDLKKLVRLARRCGLAFAPGEELDTALLEKRQVELRIKHGGERDVPPWHWLNVRGYRALPGEETPAEPDDLDSLPF